MKSTNLNVSGGSEAPHILEFSLANLKTIFKAVIAQRYWWLSDSMIRAILPNFLDRPIRSPKLLWYF